VSAAVIIDALFPTRGKSLMKIKRCALRVLLVCLSLACFCVAQRRQAPLDIRTAISTRSIDGPISLAPAGDWVAYSVTNRLERQPPKEARYIYYTPTGATQFVAGDDLWITNIQTRQTKNLTNGVGTNWGPVWSPDSSYLAFYSDRSGIAHLWVWEKATGKLRQLSDAIVRPFFDFQVVRWTSDSRQILVKALPENMNLEQAFDFATGPKTDGKLRQKAAVASTATVYSYVPEKEEAPASLEVPGWLKWDMGDLVLVDVGSGHTRRIAHGTNPIDYWISPDSKWVAYTTHKGRKAHTQSQLYDLMLVSLSNGDVTTLASNVGLGSGVSVSWSPDSHSLAYLASNDRVSGSDCFVVEIPNGRPRNVASSEHPPFGYTLRAPLWDSDGKYVYFLSSGVDLIGQRPSSYIWRSSVSDGKLTKIAAVPDKSIIEAVSPQAGGRFWSPAGGHSMTVRTRDEESKKTGFYRVDLATGSATKLTESDSYVAPESILLTDVSADGQSLVYVSEDASHPPEIRASGPDLANSRVVTDINPQLAAEILGKSRIVHWNSSDGEPLSGALLLPAEYKEGVRYPLIVYVYGGSYESDEVNQFGLAELPGDNLQILATRGYAVLLPDMPQGGATPMADLAKDVLPGIDKLVDMGIADPNNIGVMGGSYGGYSTLALIVQSPRFKAAIAAASISDLVSNYLTMDESGTSREIGWSENGQGKMLGTPWERWDRYIENSPIRHLDRIQTPLLLVDGELDWLSPDQSEEVFVGLRRLRREVVFVRYGGEDHWPGDWSPANVIDYWNRVVQWFDGHLLRNANTQ
jgi:dipeptidyl aminopeptidase/acylaminoacyl peptidase